MTTTVYKKTKVAGRTRYVHRASVETLLGRSLSWNEVVHHRNGDKTDNRPENLEIMSRREHARHHMAINPVEKNCAVCGTMFAPAPSHRKRDRACGLMCRNIEVMWARLGERFLSLDPIAIQAARVAGESARSLGRRYSVPHMTIVRICRWPPPLAEAVGRSIARAMQPRARKVGAA